MESHNNQMLNQKTPEQKSLAYEYIVKKLESVESTTCPLTAEEMSDPVFYIIGNKRYTCQRSFLLLDWIRKNGTCPFTREPLSESDLRYDHNLRQSISLESRPIDEMVEIISLQDALLFDVQCKIV